jgi:hypothetical protein
MLLCADGAPGGRRVDWSYKAVASSRNRGDIPAAGLAAAQRPSKRRDMHFEIALFDDDVRPGASHELALRDKLASTLDQRGQDLQSATAETNGCLTLQQKLLGRKEPERAERKSTFDRCSVTIVHLSSQPRLNLVLLDFT